MDKWEKWTDLMSSVALAIGSTLLVLALLAAIALLSVMAWKIGHGEPITLERHILLEKQK